MLLILQLTPNSPMRRYCLQADSSQRGGKNVKTEQIGCTYSWKRYRLYNEKTYPSSVSWSKPVTRQQSCLAWPAAWVAASPGPSLACFLFPLHVSASLSSLLVSAATMTILLLWVPVAWPELWPVLCPGEGLTPWIQSAEAAEGRLSDHNSPGIHQRHKQAVLITELAGVAKL